LAFPTTSWSLVLSARGRNDPAPQEALERLCGIYWYPVYAYMRSHGHGREDAEDLTQEFFYRLIQKQYLKAVDQARGRFRWFLQAALKRFLANEYDRNRTFKRGGEVKFLQFDIPNAEERYGIEAPDRLTPDRIFDRQWSLVLLHRVFEKLREDYRGTKKESYFEHLKQYLVGEEAAIPYRDAARALSMTEGAVRVWVHRMRRRFAAILRSEIAETVLDEREVDAEIQFLVNALRA
jgi:RNA polymerase sigma factor (sigma-70 family)